MPSQPTHRLRPPHYYHSPQPDSVLLKADRTRPAGVTPKLAGFGVTRILNGGEQPAAAAARAAPVDYAPHVAPGAPFQRAAFAVGRAPERGRARLSAGARAAGRRA